MKSTWVAATKALFSLVFILLLPLFQPSNDSVFHIRHDLTENSTVFKSGGHTVMRKVAIWADYG